MISHGHVPEILCGFVRPLELIGAAETRSENHLLTDVVGVPFPGGLEKKQTGLLVKSILQVLLYHFLLPLIMRTT